MAALHEKDAAQNLAGKWIVEFSDLARMRQADAGTLKNFITRRVDNYRPSYGRNSADHPRQCVFAASTNKDEFLVDETGARRFWPVQVQGQVDTGASSGIGTNCGQRQ